MIHDTTCVRGRGTRSSPCAPRCWEGVLEPPTQHRGGARCESPRPREQAPEKEKTCPVSACKELHWTRFSYPIGPFERRQTQRNATAVQGVTQRADSIARRPESLRRQRERASGASGALRPLRHSGRQNGREAHFRGGALHIRRTQHTGYTHCAQRGGNKRGGGTKTAAIRRQHRGTRASLARSHLPKSGPGGWRAHEDEHVKLTHT